MYEPDLERILTGSGAHLVRIRLEGGVSVSVLSVTRSHSSLVWLMPGQDNITLVPTNNRGNTERMYSEPL